MITAAWIALGSAVPATAQAVGAEIPIWVDPAGSYEPRVAFNVVHEEFLVVWYNVQGPNTWDVFARRVNLDGSLGTWFAVVSAAGELHGYPSVAFNPSRDEYLVTWHYEYALDDFDILGSLVSWNGGTIGAPFAIRFDPDGQVLPDVVYNPNHDEYLVVYQNNWAGGLQDVAAQRIDGDGSLLSWANIASSPGLDRYAVGAAFSPELDTYVLGYACDPGNPSAIELCGKLAASDLAGVSAEPEITFVSDPVDGVWNPTVAAFADGFIAQFNLASQPRARRVAADGTPLGPDDGFQVGDQISSGSIHPTRANALARADAVGYVAAWNLFSPAGDGNVYAQAVAPGFDGVSSSTLTVAAGAASEERIDIACAPWGTCLVVYFSDFDIAGRIVRLDVFADGYDETGDTGRWSITVP
jgi:hypothetical protein